jgi:sec-independent protein translocase protein TatB
VFLFIFESIGTSELLLIGMIALIFLGPRRLPEYARKIGKILADLRSTTNDFKETWQREVNFEEEVKAFTSVEDETKQPTAPVGSIVARQSTTKIAAPNIREIDPPPESIEAATVPPNVPESSNGNQTQTEIDPNDRRNWL